MMKKYITYKLLGVAVIVAGMFACDTASQEVEPVISPDTYPIATFVNATGNTVVEGQSVIYNITIDKMIERTVTFSLNQTGGTAVEGENYTCDPVVLQPYTKSVQLIIETLKDYDPSASSTIIGEIAVLGIAEKYLLNPATVFPEVSLTITNFVSPDLEVSFSWSADVMIEGKAYDAGENIDFDFLISPEVGFDINDPWASELGNYEAATGDHPEEMVLSGLADGTYILWCDLSKNWFIGDDTDGSVKIPIVASFTRQGTELVGMEVSMNPADMASDNTYGYSNVPSNTFNKVIAKVTLAGGKYTITKYDNTTIGPYKSGAAKTPRPLNYKR